jgi:hypothetical protein
VSDKNTWSILLSEGTSRGGNILIERRQRLLHDGDVIAIFDQNVVNTFPARAIRPRTMNENNIPYAMADITRGLDGLCGARQIG